MGLLPAQRRKRNYYNYLAFILDGPLVASLEGVLLGTKDRLPYPIQGVVRHHEKAMRHTSPNRCLPNPLSKSEGYLPKKAGEKGSRTNSGAALASESCRVAGLSPQRFEGIRTISTEQLA
jgi:hypothetical protein